MPRLIASPATKLDGPATAEVLSPARHEPAAKAEAAITLAAHHKAAPVPTNGANKNPAGVKPEKKAGLKDFWVRKLLAPD
jgi:hypothetical protein